jgi:hypothetical protein
MKEKFTKKNIGLAILLFLVISQFFKIDKVNHDVHSDQDFLSITNPTEKVATMIKNQCYDCHSNESTYPWYSDYAPLSWWVKSNVNGAREKINFSTWGLLPEKKRIGFTQEIVEALEEGEMPVAIYVWGHEKAQFSDEDNKALLDWFKNQ